MNDQITYMKCIHMKKMKNIISYYNNERLNSIPGQKKMILKLLYRTDDE
jgi:hypothetical protein